MHAADKHRKRGDYRRYERITNYMATPTLNTYYSSRTLSLHLFREFPSGHTLSVCIDVLRTFGYSLHAKPSLIT